MTVGGAQSTRRSPPRTGGGFTKELTSGEDKKVYAILERNEWSIAFRRLQVRESLKGTCRREKGNLTQKGGKKERKEKTSNHPIGRVKNGG